ncbi:MAG: sigma-70 family RNA polymerase sigma factor [Kiritimatiellae bacterium]|nr:sigma-70 family RNA polymerase sigma factor [Kiritimatiellia bacterium]
MNALVLMDTPEHHWVNEYRAGNAVALDNLIEHTRRPLYAFINKMMEGHADADEIFQETWVRAIQNLNRYRDDKLLSWLFRIAHNLIIDRIRKRTRLTSFEQASTDEGQSFAERLAEPSPSPADTAASNDLQAHIGAAVQQLPPEQREVFLLRTEADLPFKEIARIQGVSINTALARMQYAVHKLRSELRSRNLAPESAHE